MGRRPSATLCYGIEVPREKLEAFIESISPDVEEYYDEWSEALNKRYKDQKLDIAFQHSDWFSDLEDVVIYIRSYSTGDWGEVIEISPEDLSASSTYDLLGEMVLVNVQKDLGVAIVAPKWFLFADYY